MRHCRARWKLARELARLVKLGQTPTLRLYHGGLSQAPDTAACLTCDYGLQIERHLAGMERAKKEKARREAKNESKRRRRQELRAEREGLSL